MRTMTIMRSRGGLSNAQFPRGRVLYNYNRQCHGHETVSRMSCDSDRSVIADKNSHSITFIHDSVVTLTKLQGHRKV